MSGAFHPEPEFTSVISTCAPKGGFCVNSCSNFYSASFLLNVGGSLKLSLNLISGTIKLPALLTGLKPVIPVMVNCGLHVRFRISYSVLFEQHCTP